MRPEKLGFEECDLDPIFRNITKKSQTDSKESSSSSDKTGKLPLPRDLGPKQGKVKVYSYCKIVHGTDDPNQNIVSESESCEEIETPSQKNTGSDTSEYSSDIISTLSSRDSSKSKKSDKKESNTSNENLSKLTSNEEINSISSNDITSGGENVTKVCPNILTRLDKEKRSKGLSEKTSSKCLKKKKHKAQNENSTSSDLNLIGTYSNKSCHKGLGKKECIKGVQENISSCQRICKDKYLDKACEEYLNRQLPKKSIEDKRFSDDLPKKTFGKYLERKCSKKHLSDGSSSYSSCTDNSEKISDEDLLSRCKEYLECKCSIKRVEGRLNNNSALFHKKISHSKNLNLNCKEISDEDQKECEEYLHRKYSKRLLGIKEPSSHSSISNNYLEDTSSYKNHPKEKSSNKDFKDKSSCKKKNSSCKDSCKDKYLKKECEEYLHKKCLKNQVENIESSSQSSFLANYPIKKSSHKRLCKKRACQDLCSKKSDKYLKRNCKKYLKKKYSKNQGEKISSSYSSVCLKDQSSLKNIDKKKSNESLKKKCEQYLKCFKKHFEDSSPVGSSDMGNEKSRDKVFVNKKATLKNICNQTPTKRNPKQKNSNENGEQATENYLPKNKSRKGFNNNEICELCREWSNNHNLKKKASDEDSCKDNRKKGTSQKEPYKNINREDQLIYCLPLLENITKSPSNKTILEDKNESEEIKTPSQLCFFMCPCYSGTPSRDATLKDSLKTEVNNPSESVNKSYFTIENESKHSCVPVPDPPKPDKNQNTIWNCLSILLGRAKKSDVDTSSMDSESETKKCFTNPKKKSRPIGSDIKSDDLKKNKSSTSESSKTSVDSKNKNKESDSASLNDSKKACSEKELIRRLTECKKKVLQECEPKIDLSNSPSMFKSSSDSIDTDRPKSIIDAHCETMATIKCAMQDLVCRVYETTSEVATAAITRIQTEGAKQLDNIRNYKRDDEPRGSCTPPKRKTRECSDGENDDTANKVIYNIGHNSPKPDTSQPKTMLDQIMTHVDSAVSAVNSTVSMVNESVGFIKIKPRSYNDASSKYDVPDLNLSTNNNCPKKVSYVVNDDTATTTSMFRAIKNKILSLFTDVNVDTPAANETSDTISEVVSEVDSDEDITNKLTD